MAKYVLTETKKIFFKNKASAIKYLKKTEIGPIQKTVKGNWVGSKNHWRDRTNNLNFCDFDEIWIDKNTDFNELKSGDKIYIKRELTSLRRELVTNKQHSKEKFYLRAKFKG
jgi:hypothetical protein